MNFADQILRWYETNHRKLPWRNSSDPYKIWLSEVILQQTRVDQGMAYYLRFVNQYPDVKKLAEAPEKEVLKLWQGLGYYSRARNLHFAASQIMKDFHGKFPKSYLEIIKLKGVGEYTAAAIASIAYGEAVAVVDGNVKRVISRIYGIEESGNQLYKSVKQVMAMELDKARPGDFNQAVMEFGALQCTPKKPDCGECIFNESCYAFRKNLVDQLPAREEKKRPQKRYFSYFVIRDEHTMVLRKRTGDDIWKNLYEFPLIESDSELNPGDLLEEPDFNSWFGTGAKISGSGKEYKHQLSHQTIHARYYTISDIDTTAYPRDWKVIFMNKIEEYPVSRLMERYLEERDL